VAAAPSDNPFPAREALREIVAEHGPEALSSPPLMSSLLADFLPDDQPLARLLVAAAGERTAESLLDHVAHGMDTATAVQLATSALAARTLFTPEACAWAATEIAAALGLQPPGPAPAPGPGPIQTAAAITSPAPAPVATMPPTPEPPPPGKPRRRRAATAALLGGSILVAGALIAAAILATSRSPIHLASSGHSPHPGTGTPPPASSTPDPGASTPAASPPASLSATGYRITTTLNPHTPGSMTTVAWTPNGTTVATSDKNGIIYLWDPATGHQQGRPLEIAGAGKAYSTAISPDGSLLAAGYSSGTTYLWNLASRHLIGALPDPGSTAGKEVNTVAFSPDGHTLVTADGNGASYLWPVSPGQPATAPSLTLADPASTGVWSAAFSSRGTLATGDYAGIIDLWNPATGARAGHITLPGGLAVTALAWNPAGTILAAGTGSAQTGTGALYLINPASRADRSLGSIGPVWALSFTGSTLAAADGNGQTYLWTNSTAALTATAAGTLPDPSPGTGGVGAVAYSPGGQQLATGDTNGQAYLWITR
jgi:WD40 repeat protein